MNSNVTYISYRNREPLMEGLGMTLTTLKPSGGIFDLLRKLQASRFMIAFVSEEVYYDFKSVIDAWSEDGLVISILSPIGEGKSIGAKRIQDLLGSATGLKKG